MTRYSMQVAEILAIESPKNKVDFFFLLTDIGKRAYIASKFEAG